MNHLTLRLDTVEDSKLFAERLAGEIGPGLSVGLIGELGAGKTTLVRYLVNALGASEPVSSPSYVLQHEYHCNDFIIEHWDLYRLKELPEELLEPPKKNVLRLIEWADRVPEFVESLDGVIRIDIVGGEECVREVECNF